MKKQKIESCSINGHCVLTHTPHITNAHKRACGTQHTYSCFLSGTGSKLFFPSVVHSVPLFLSLSSRSALYAEQIQWEKREEREKKSEVWVRCAALRLRPSTLLISCEHHFHTYNTIFGQRLVRLAAAPFFSSPPHLYLSFAI